MVNYLFHFRCSWYFGEISREKTNEILVDQPVGTYLVRDSTTRSGYALDVKEANGVKRYLISYLQNTKKFRFGEYLFDTFDDLIRHYTGTKSASRLVRPAPKPVYIGLYDFQSQDVADLSFNRGDRLYFIRQKQQWVLCRSESEQVGWVPSNYLVQFSPELAIQLSGQTGQAALSNCRKAEFLRLPVTAHVIRSRTPSIFLTGHLKIQIGDTVKVIRVLSDGFCEVLLKDRPPGLVPINCLQVECL
ncbi:unnamed protein product [Dicrocoelium dendriticum]|nr:unnamed protein product [Dicrocoelium dendriticum]